MMSRRMMSRLILSRRMSSRRGVSLIEVLFSIGIVAVGLLGILLLAPLAMRQIGQGNDYDRTSRMGMNAMAEFEIRAMGNWENWRYFSTATSPGQFLPVPFVAPQNSVAIDPYALSLSGNQTAAGTLFPANAPIQMDRYSLRSVPPSVAPPPVAVPYTFAMSSQQADRVFILRDELVFEVPEDVSKPPAQVYDIDQGPDGQWGVATVDDDANGSVDDGTEAGWPGSDDLATTRQNEGVYSWLATLTPKLDTRAYPENFPRDYVLSIVVFRNRDFDVTNGSSERSVEVAAIYGDGTTGGDMLLRTLAAAANPSEDLQGVREGQWILLACNLPAYAGAGSVEHYGWYRIDSVDDEPVPNGGKYELNVALSGPDWPAAMAVKAAAGAEFSTTGTQASLFKNVIAVYQKVVHLETSSLWTN